MPILILSLCAFLDFATTYIAIVGFGATEANPVVFYVLNSIGWKGLIIQKLIMIATAALMLHTNKRWTEPKYLKDTTWLLNGAILLVAGANLAAAVWNAHVIS